MAERAGEQVSTIERDVAGRDGRRLAVVVNPAKADDLEQLTKSIGDAAENAGWAVSWYRTTTDEPGESQARQAVAEGAELVCSLGGDGTVRAVASGLVGTQTPLGILPGGTGNLLARNLGLPVDDLMAALQVVLTGEPRAVDVGAVTWDDDPEQIFLVIAGMGLDARMIGEADERIKKGRRLAGLPAVRGARAVRLGLLCAHRWAGPAGGQPAGPSRGGRQLRSAARRPGSHAGRPAGRRSS